MNLEHIYIYLIIVWAVVELAAVVYFVDVYFTEKEAREEK
jgi:hypothetical protein